MRDDDLSKLIMNAEYDDTEEQEYNDEQDMYDEPRPKKMTKREFIREMLRLQEEKKLYYN